ncbi:LysR family transcriptional regulator [Ferrimonas kyonanensis]|uniref:LysR family transcriptional regulator n=1 Tax=Ferrimonas kyonanensis TaxID=364763 RepID=UPI00040D37B9|nr:LysR family transcriptional regulator [Ferrimonas kyonanensis]
MLLEGIETLLTLSQERTMTRTATRLYLTQSAVSKRIAKLERLVGKKLVEPDGRQIRLTEAAQELVASIGPSYIEIRGLVFDQQTRPERSAMDVACSETLLAGYLKPIAAELLNQDPHIRFSTHHTPMILEKVQSGEAVLGYCAGQLPGQHGLVTRHLFDEPFVVISHAPTTGLPPSMLVNDLSNPANSMQVATLHRLGITPMMQMDSYTAAAQLALAGVGPALVPMATVQTLGIARKYCFNFEELRALTRPVHLCYRQRSGRLPRVARLIEAIARAVPTTT